MKLGYRVRLTQNTQKVGGREGQREGRRGEDRDRGEREGGREAEREGTMTSSEEE